MKCTSCQHENTKVLDSRTTDSGYATRRRRVCEACGFRFTTFERSQHSSLLVKKRDGTTQPYQREKLERSIMLACVKRPVDIQVIREKLTELEESKWVREAVIPAQTIGEDVMDILRDLDGVAYIRFASVYKRFKDTDSFAEEVKKVLQNEGP